MTEATKVFWQVEAVSVGIGMISGAVFAYAIDDHGKALDVIGFGFLGLLVGLPIAFTLSQEHEEPPPPPPTLRAKPGDARIIGSDDLQSRGIADEG